MVPRETLDAGGALTWNNALMSSDSAEQRPLLASYAAGGDPEAAGADPTELSSERPTSRWQAKTARILASERLHKTVIALVRWPLLIDDCSIQPLLPALDCP